MKIRVNLWPNLTGAISAGLLVAGFCLILLWHNPLVFWNDDYELSVLPVFADMARSWSEGQWPILSPHSWVCGNLAGEFQYGAFSLFVNAAVILIWKFPLTFPQQAAALSIAHLVVLAIGAFLLGRGRGFSLALSIFVSLIASLNGWIICWGRPIGLVHSVHSPGCLGHGGGLNAHSMCDEPIGVFSGRRLSFISSSQVDFPTQF